MCGIYQNPYEIARSLTVAATEKIVINPAGKSVEESNADLGRQVALVYRTILRELLRDELMSGDEDAEDASEHVHSHIHDHDDGLPHDHTHSHSHDHSHVHARSH
jgi:hypothetical protein